MPERKEQFKEAIKQFIPISDLSASAQNDVIETADILELKKRKFVFKEGDKDNYSYYVLAGELELIAGKQVHSTIVGGADNARYALAQLQPRQFSAKAKTPVTLIRLDRSALDRLMVHEGNKEADISDTDDEMGVSHIEEEDSGDWMTRMLQSELFARLPMANIQQLFAFLEPVAFVTGEAVIKQGDPGDNYYIIQEGTCEVTRVPGEGKDPVKLAELVVGDSFGEEALLTDTTRNATITMLSDGVLMKLNKDSFVDLIKKPSLSSVAFEQARQIVEEGGEWIDVRFTKEYEASHIETSTNIALNVIRAQIDKFNPDTHYVLCCDTGGRSSAAAFLLTQRGFHVSYLEGGLVSNPQAATDAAPAPEPEPEKVVEEPVDKLEQTIDDVDPAVKASVLETDLAKNKMELEAAEKKQKEEKEQTDKKRQEALAAEKKKLEQERVEIEKQKKLAEEDLDRTREEERVKIEKTRTDAESRMRDEKEKLEEIYSKNTDEMKKLQEMKARAEAQIKKAREQLEKQAEQSKRELDEARNLKSSVEKAKKKIDKEAEQQRVKQAELEKNVKAKAKALLEQEKRKLAEKVAQNNEELEQAKRDKAIAEAGRVAAKEEAEKIIDEYKSQFAEEKAELEALLKAERAKLEKEAQQIKDKLSDVHKIKKEAETASKLAEKEANKLKAKQEKKIKKGTEDKTLEDEMKLAEERLEEARRALDDAQHEEKITEAAKEENEGDLLRQKEEEEKLNLQMQAELNEWKEEEDERQEQFIGKESQEEHIRRIQERAAEAQKKTKDAAEDMFADISSQIIDDSHHKLR